MKEANVMKYIRILILVAALTIVSALFLVPTASAELIHRAAALLG
jgi:hypothetical protein